MSAFRDRIRERTLLLDGAMGTMLQAAALKPGQCPELLNVDHPGAVADVHRAYRNAGADAVETNSFGGNRIKLSAFGLEGRTRELNLAAVTVAREAAGADVLVGASVGPTGRFVQPVGDLTFEKAFDVFSEQIGALAEGGADFVIFETFSDIKELRAAVMAANAVCGLPVVALMTFEPTGQTLLGGTPEAAAVTLEALGVAALGANCSLGPDGILQVLSRMASVTELPLAGLPNAGMPVLRDGVTVFPAGPEEMAGTLTGFLDIGVGIFGGCCGTTPDHIKRFRETLDAGPAPSPRSLTDPEATRLSSRQSVLFIGGNSPIRAIGERLNPTGRRALAEAVRAGRFDVYREEARSQAEAGADMLDVNVGVPGIDEAQAMGQAVLAVQQAAAVPMSVDSPRPEVIEAGLQAADGKVLINSVTGEAESLDKVLPLAARYGAAVLGLTLDEKGIPYRAEDRVAIARRILEAAAGYGLSPRDVMIDCLTLSAGAEQESVMQTIETLRIVGTELGLNTLLGVSNISFGLPGRESLNAAFLAMAASAGLSAAIVNPFHRVSMDILSASRVILNQDPKAARYIQRHTGKDERTGAEEEAAVSPEESLRRSVIEGNPDTARTLSAQILAAGTPPMELGEKVLIPAMSEVGDRFARNEYFLPQVLMSAKAMKEAFEPIREMLKGQDIPSRGHIVIATVEGDIHDIGKNIVITLLENHGFQVTDLGKNVAADEIVRTAVESGCDGIGLSALMTTTMAKMKEAVRAIRDAGLQMPVVVGGAAVTEDFAGEIGADGYAEDATAAVSLFLNLIEAKGRP